MVTAVVVVAVVPLRFSRAKGADSLTHENKT